MKIATTIILTAGATSAFTFDEYQVKFGKSYATDAEMSLRKQLFTQRATAVADHNARDERLYTKTLNHLSDRTKTELQQIKGLDKAMLHHQMSLRSKLSTSNTATIEDLRGFPDSLDWRKKNVITPVKNQGECGSCWTFASAETIESHMAIQTGMLQELSEQFILDCTPNPHECGGSGGCGGGTAELAFDRLTKLGGIPSEWEYPYVSALGNSSTCHGLPLSREQAHSGAVSAAANITGYWHTTTISYADLLMALVTKGPLAISVDAGAWHDYSGGIFDGGNKTNPDLDHLVQLVGYGVDQGESYWLVRNSWTPYWGEKGFIRLKRYDPLKGEKASCGTDVTPLDGNGCAGGPSTVQVCGQSGVLFDGVYPLL